MTPEILLVLVLLGGLGIGAVAAKVFFTQARDTIIEVFGRDGTWKSETKDKKVRLKKLMFMRWRIKERDRLPHDARIEVRFEGDESPFVDKRPKDDGNSGSRVIGALVPFGARPKTYKYTVYFVQGTHEQPIEDPEIIIEGDFVHLYPKIKA
jgi:hypothetical protein